jgi:hypothetical protein
MAVENIKQSIEEINERKRKLEQKISEALLEFENSTSLQIESLDFTRRSSCTEQGTEIDFRYITEARVLLK